MADYVISDIHVKWDMTNSEPLKKFLEIDFKPEDRIYFLGDIFDLMVGSYDEYEGHYDWFFTRIKELAKAGLKIFYIQGNHDFHIEELLAKSGIIVKSKPFVEIINGQKVLFCHGDEIEIENFNYKIWRAFIRSYPLALISKYIFNYKIVKKIGDYLSQKSRNRNEKRYGETQKNDHIRDKFRQSALIASKSYNVDIIICGHSHYMDSYHGDSFEYYNCGFVPATMKYLKITERYELLPL
ncbi:UDP-2,3-diacylglucosamine diphosphatase [Halobacteriovorax vibrionivorans]|uniref:UDP-2,3-diacylglucosamine diphosphatase n=1 Tax=Halobacteriovorax vibrionivorans TaxID=2152716 RepID=A0ABY0IJM3_9BACT|nr:MULTISPECIES: UDP-2,3-diacylglucosamine diphosphatase [Halobacteriovorax]RZF23155.1 UDP-2,3-diacylglucosamine diphosphatase [Halobacteriovorax vibrionivorans]TGD45937.1 UDP-2,3-diacylglucosamine diphosphatase [Halobacteriovorax sp. Y22]